jgi:hypothetical protein
LHAISQHCHFQKLCTGMAFGNQFKKWIEGGHGVESTIADVE